MRRVHQLEERLGAPDQGVDQGPNLPLGQIGGDQPNMSCYSLGASLGILGVPSLLIVVVEAAGGRFILGFGLHHLL